MIRRIAAVSALAIVATLAVTPANAQPKPTGPTDAGRGRAFVSQLAADNPNTFKCAHTPAACGWNFIKLLACKLNPEPSLGPWGLNGKRGNPRDLSYDALNFRGEGPGTDATTGKAVTVIDVIASAGGPTPSAAWTAFDDPVASSGAFVAPRCKGDVPDTTAEPEPPPPAPSKPPYPGDEVFDQIADALFADYANVGNPPNPGMGRWFGRTVFDWLAGNEKTLPDSIKKHRAEWCALLGGCKQ